MGPTSTNMFAAPAEGLHGPARHLICVGVLAALGHLRMNHLALAHSPERHALLQRLRATRMVPQASPGLNE